MLISVTKNGGEDTSEALLQRYNSQHSILVEKSHQNYLDLAHMILWLCVLLTYQMDFKGQQQVIKLHINIQINNNIFQSLKLLSMQYEIIEYCKLYAQYNALLRCYSADTVYADMYQYQIDIRTRPTGLSHGVRFRLLLFF